MNQTSPREKVNRSLKKLSDFKWMGVALTLFSAPALLVYGFWGPAAPKFLTLSPERWWGLFTSSFVHGSLSHLGHNLLGLFFFPLLLAIVNARWPRQKRKYISKVFFVAVLISGTVVAGTFELMARHSYASLPMPRVGIMGMSGAVFAAVGVFLASMLGNIFQYVQHYFQNSDFRFERDEKLSLFLNIFFTFAVLYMISSPGFFGSTRDVATLGHSSGFYSGFLISLVSISMENRGL